MRVRPATCAETGLRPETGNMPPRPARPVTPEVAGSSPVAPALTGRLDKWFVNYSDRSLLPHDLLGRHRRSVTMRRW
jgi:hypothetical protein